MKTGIRLFLVLCMSEALFASSIPSVKELLSNLEVQTCFLELQEIAEKKDKKRKPQEVSAWLVQEELAGKTHFRCVYWPGSWNQGQAIWEGEPPAGTIANLHSHPRNTKKGLSTEDLLLAKSYEVMVFVVGSDGRWLYWSGNLSNESARGDMLYKGKSLRSFFSDELSH